MDTVTTVYEVWIERDEMSRVAAFTSETAACLLVERLYAAGDDTAEIWPVTTTDDPQAVEIIAYSKLGTELEDPPDTDVVRTCRRVLVAGVDEPGQLDRARWYTKTAVVTYQNEWTDAAGIPWHFVEVCGPDHSQVQALVTKMRMEPAR